MTVQGVTKAGTVAIGGTMFGQTSKASAWFLNDQITADKIYFKYQSGYGNVGLGTTGFVDGEIIWFGVVRTEVLVLVQLQLEQQQVQSLDRKELLWK